MARRRRDRSGEKAEALFKLGFIALMLVALGLGGVTHFVPVLISLLTILVIVLAAGGVIALLAWWLIRQRRRDDTTAFIGSKPRVSRQDNVRPAQATAVWTVPAVREALGRIDWYQFEKFCASLLEADGFSVARLGGAHPDGGVDLIVAKDGARALIQCKHWRTWDVKENIVREMLGSMTALKVRQGAIYTLKGWTRPAAEFAAQHGITLVNGDELAESAQSQFSAGQLEQLLRPGVRHCPKCEAPMILRQGDFPSFWGCSRYPACRGKMKHENDA